MPGLTGTIVLDYDLPHVRNTVDIQGPGADLLAIDGQDNYPIFVFNDVTPTAFNVSVSGMTIRHGRNNVTGGGGIYSKNENVTVRDVVLENNTSTAGQGGGILIEGGTLNLVNSVVRDNSANDGGGIRNDGGAVVIADSTVAGNTGTNARAAGGYYQSGGSASLVVTDSSFTGNQGGSGGGLYISEGTAAIDRSLIANNKATNLNVSDGGGLFVTGTAAVVLRNVTVSGNQSNDNAGGIRFDGGSLEIRNSTIASNISNVNNGGGGPGGGLYASAGNEARLFSTIVAKNQRRSDLSPIPDDINGAIDGTSANNLIGVGTNLSGVSNGTQGNLIGSSGMPLDSLLDPLAANGGPTLTHALQPASPARDAGDDAGLGLTTDGRGAGFARVAGTRADIGAFEIQAAPSVTPPVAPPVTPSVPPPVTPPTPGTAVLIGSPQFAVGSGPGGSAVSLYNPDRSVRFTGSPLGDSPGGVRTASADFTGDGVADLVVGTGPGRATRVLVLDGVTQAVLFDLAPFEASFTGGVYVAAGDLNGDGRADLVVTPDEGGGPRARVFSGAGFGQLADFFGIDDPSFRGGARPAVADITGDGRADLVVAAGFGGGPRVAVFSGALLAAEGGQGGQGAALWNAWKPFGDFLAFEPELRNGAFVGAGDINGDGLADLVAGGGPGGGPRVTAFSGSELLSNRQTVLANYFAGDVNNRGGVRVAVKNLDGDNQGDIVTGAGVGAGSQVTTYAGKTVGQANPPALAAFDGLPGSNGVFVG